MGQMCQVCVCVCSLEQLTDAYTCSVPYVCMYVHMYMCIFSGLMLQDARMCVLYNICVTLKHIPYYTLYIVCIHMYTYIRTYVRMLHTSIIML